MPCPASPDGRHILAAPTTEVRDLRTPEDLDDIVVYELVYLCCLCGQEVEPKEANREAW